MKYTVILISLFFFPAAILYAQDKDCTVDFSKYKFSCNLPCEVKLVTANDSLIRYEGLIKQGGSEYVAVDFTFTPNSNPSIGETVALMEGYYRKLKFTGDKGTYKGMRYNNRLAGPSQVDELFIDSDFLDYPDGRNSVGIIRNDYIYRSCEGVAIFFQEDLFQGLFQEKYMMILIFSGMIIAFRILHCNLIILSRQVYLS